MPDHPLPEPRIAPETASGPERPVARRRGPILWGLAILLALGAAGGWALRHRPTPAPAPAASQAEPPAALTVVLAPATLRPLRRPAIGDGSVIAWQELVIGSETGGLRVQEVAFDEGQSVRQGDVLVRLDASVPAAQAAQAEAAVTEAEAVLRLAEADLRRSSELMRTDNVARQTLESRQSAMRQAEARLATAIARRDEAQARLAQATIQAPHDGVVSRRSILPGAVVQPGQELLRLIRDGRLELAARVPELELSAIAPGQTARIFHGEREIAGTVRAIAPVVAGDTRLGIVHVALPADAGLRPGMFARAEIAPADPRPAVTVPQEAVVLREGGPVVFVVPEGGDHAEQRRIATGLRRDGAVEITSGLAAGEKVVATGAGFLTDGDRIRVAPAL